MRHTRFEKHRSAGSTMVELALGLPLLLLLTLGAMDLGRMYFHAVTAANAAATGAFYGAQSNVKTGHFDDMVTAAKQDAEDIGTVTATAERFCGCPDGTKVACAAATCAGYGPPRVYVRTTVRQNFNPLVKYPGIPRPTLGRSAYFRAQ